MTSRTRQQVTLPITPAPPASSQAGGAGLAATLAARLRALAAQWTALANEQMRVHRIGTGRTDNPDLWRDIAMTAQGRARQLEDCAADLMALAADLEDTCNPES